MKLPYSLLQQFIDLPTKDEHKLRVLLDELGLEVEEVLHENGETFFKIETLAHRGDHLYALGIARELSAHFVKSLKHVRLPLDFHPEKLSLPVTVSTTLCERYFLMSVDLPEKIPLSKGIEQCMPGLDTTKHPMVHLLNYVFMELGQPLHGFDSEKISGSLRVVESTKEEKIVALDGKEYTVPVGSLLIRDDEKIVAVAGVIGCANSMMTPSTRHVLIESAAFDPVAVRKTAKKMGLSTDASYAFERGSDIDAVEVALKRVVELLMELSGVSMDSLHLKWSTYSPKEKRKEIAVSFDLLRKQADKPSLSTEAILERLTLLGYTVKRGHVEDVYTVLPPSWRRWNVLTEGAVIEDWIRVVGFNEVPLSLPPMDPLLPKHSPSERLLEKIEQTFLGNGFSEVVTRSYYSKESVSWLQALDLESVKRHISIKNSVDKDNAFMKRTNCLSIAKCADYNLRKGVLSFKVYEFARLFDLEQKASFYPFEREVFSFAVSGRWFDSEWKKGETNEEKLFLMKGVLDQLFQRMGFEAIVAKSQVPFLHPGCQASIHCQGKEVGFFGLLHPFLKEQMNLLDDVVYGELDGETLYLINDVPKKKSETSEFPAIKRDLTFALAPEQLAHEICDYIQALTPQHLVSIAIRDSFKKGAEETSRVTYRLHFQSLDRTLSHEEVDQAMNGLLSQLKERYGVQIV